MSRERIETEYKEIVTFFEQFSNPDSACDGLERFFSVNGHIEVFTRFARDKKLNLNKVQLNQLFIASGLPSISFGFFKYYWLSLPNDTHPYNIVRLSGHEEDFVPSLLVEENDDGYGVFKLREDSKQKDLEEYIYQDESGRILLRNSDGTYLPGDESLREFYEAVPNTVIKSWHHFRWGFRRLYVDSLLFFGNITLGFTELGRMNEESLVRFFNKKSFDAELIKERGHALDFVDIPEEDRYLISEMACQNLSIEDGGENRLRKRLVERYTEARNADVNRIKVGVLLSGEKITKRSKSTALRNVREALDNKQLVLSMDMEISTSDIFDEVIGSFKDIDKVLEPLAKRFKSAREAALRNTRLYLSLINDMDVYVATSMRNKLDFLKMAKNCEEIFKGFPETRDLNLRYFDPTMSAAEGHEDKGIIECLMVKCAKVLIYTSGDKDSYGKDAEAAMALSSGKPVIFLCDIETRSKIFRDVHPLSKLIDFKTGVANGAMIASTNQEVAEILNLIFNNNMEFTLTREVEQGGDDANQKKAYFRLIDNKTGSTVRIQTSDLFLSKAFWNYYHHHIRI